eukprot:2087251-Prymnesium_polylepis.1
MALDINPREASPGRLYMLFDTSTRYTDDQDEVPASGIGLPGGARVASSNAARPGPLGVHRPQLAKVALAA